MRERSRTTSLNRRRFLQSAGATLVASSVSVPAFAQKRRPLRFFLGTDEDYYQRFLKRRLDPILLQNSGIDCRFPLDDNTAFRRNPRRAVRAMAALLEKERLDVVAVPESWLPAVMEAFKDELVDLSPWRDRLDERKIGYLHSDEKVFAFNMLGDTALLALSSNAEAMMPEVIEAIGDALAYQVFMSASGPHQANGADPSIVDIQIIDFDGNPVEIEVFVALTLPVDNKVAHPAVSLGGGVYQALVPSELAGHAHLTVVDATGHVLDPESGAATVEFLPGELTHFRLVSKRSAADADGVDEVLYEVYGLDELSNLVPRDPDEIRVECDLGVAEVRPRARGGLEIGVRSTDLGATEVRVFDEATGVGASFQASFPMLRLSDSDKVTVILPSEGEPPAQACIPLIAFTPESQPVTGYDVTVEFDDTMCGIDDVVVSDPASTTSFKYSVRGGQLNIQHSFLPTAGRTELVTIKASAFGEGSGVESINPDSSSMQTATGSLPLSADLVADVVKEHKQIDKVIRLKIKIVMGTGGASLGTTQEAKDKACKLVDKLNEIYCQARIKFVKEVAILMCDLGANGLDEYKPPGGLTCEEKNLIDKCKPGDEEIVAFVVGGLSCNSLGESVSDGQFPCEVGNGRTGSVVIDDSEVEDSDSKVLGHEIGHILLGNGDHPDKSDFPSCDEYEDNLMHPTRPPNGTTITPEQAEKMRQGACNL